MPTDTEPGEPGTSPQPAGGDQGPDLGTTRSGLRFVEPSVEDGYLAWREGGRLTSPLAISVLVVVLLAALEVWLVTQQSDGDLAGSVLVVVSAAIGIGVVLTLAAAMVAGRRSRLLYARERTIDHQAEALRAARTEAARLLRTIVPDAVAQRLERGTGTVADFHPDVTVVVADLVGFGALVPALRPVDLVDSLNAVFTRFDALADLYEVERLKTVGDSYVAVAGLPGTRQDHAVAAAELALAMRAAVQQFNEARRLDLSVRIGMASGPVVAGVVGNRRFAYDLWGRTMATAAGLEQTAETGRIQISGPTSLKLGATFPLQRRDGVRLDGLGEVEAWYLDGT